MQKTVSRNHFNLSVELEVDVIVVEQLLPLTGILLVSGSNWSILEWKNFFKLSFMKTIGFKALSQNYYIFIRHVSNMKKCVDAFSTGSFGIQRVLPNFVYPGSVKEACLHDVVM